MVSLKHKTRQILRIMKVAVFFLLLVAIFAIYKSDTVMIKIPKKLTAHIYSRTNLDFFPMWQRILNFLFRIEDEINIFLMKKNLLDGGLPIYSLELNPNDLIHFDDLSKLAIKSGHLPPESNSWRKSKLTVDGKEYQVKVRFHGDNPDHWTNKLKSYQIRSDKDEYINNMRRFNLIIFEDRLFAPLIGRETAKQFGLMDIRNGLAVLKINGVIQGVYYLEERLDENFLDYNQCSGCAVVSISDNWVDDHKYDISNYKSADPNGVFWTTGHRTAFDYELSNAEIDADLTQMGSVFYPIDRLYYAVNNNNISAINFFDREQLSSFQAFRMVLGNLHSIVGDNLRMVYQTTNSKFYPAPQIEVATRLKLKNGGIDNYLNTFGRPINLFYLLAKDDESRYLTHKKIYSFILNNEILDNYDRIMDKYGSYALSYKANKLSRREMRYSFKELKEILQYNMEITKRNLDYSKFYANIVHKDNRVKIEIIPDSVAEIRFTNSVINLTHDYSGEIGIVYNDYGKPSKFKLIKLMDKTKLIDLTSQVKDFYFSAGLDNDLYPAIRRYTIEIIFSDANKVSIGSIIIKMKNDITNKEIADSDSYIQIANANDYYENSKYGSIEEFERLYPKFRWAYNNGELTLLEGDYVVDNDLIIPKFKSFMIQEGVKIKIAENKSILSYSPTQIAGTRNKPVVITSLEKGKPFGTFAIVGEGSKNEKTFANWLDISGGKDKWINGMFFIGQFAIHHIPNIYINNSLIHGSHSDDGINVKYAQNLIIENSHFYGNSADQADLDFVNGIVKNSEFNGNGELDSNGDGLDLSGSNMIVKDSNFVNLLDKGISVGESTKLIVYKNSLSNNNLGIAVKDSSVAYLMDNNFRNNKVAVTAYQKKELFGGSTAYVYGNSFNLNQKDFEQDNQSKIYQINLATENYNKLRSNAERELLSFP
ncbi:MAG: right-handed parallel beta-helix repeat-containing protein [Nanoarchaeota archaeon]|mgnify:CR=1 FL=1